MKYTTLGRSGLIVSKLSFGTMTLGGNGQGPLGKVEAATAERMVGLALDAGINFFDTADVYNAGESERVLGKALGARLKDAIIATKVVNRMGPGLHDAGASARHIHDAVDASLARLGRDWIDLYIAHRPDPRTPLEETLYAFEQVVRAGKVRYLGFSNWPAWVAARAVEIQRRHGWSPFVNGQMYYSLLGRDIEQEAVPCFQEYGIGLTVWSPLASGFLSGRYTRENPKGDGSGRLAHFNITPFEPEKGYAVIDVVIGIALKHGTSAAAVSLAWLMGRPSMASVILGITSEQQLRENMAAADVTLDEADLQALDEVSKPQLLFPHWFIRRALSSYGAPPEGFEPWA